jgi:hypothetical protein
MGMEVTGDICIGKGSCMICTARQIILQRSDQGGEMGWALACIGTTEMHTGLWRRNLKEKDHFEVLVVYDRIILK